MPTVPATPAPFESMPTRPRHSSRGEPRLLSLTCRCFSLFGLGYKDGSSWPALACAAGTDGALEMMCRAVRDAKKLAPGHHDEIDQVESKCVAQLTALKDDHHKCSSDSTKCSKDGFVAPPRPFLELTPCGQEALHKKKLHARAKASMSCPREPIRRHKAAVLQYVRDHATYRC